MPGRAGCSLWLRVGAYKPKMLGLTGRAADGWLPSLSYLPGGPADLTGMNRHIDEAAAAAGRDPAAIRRLLNISGQFTPTGQGLLTGPAAQWAEQLADITLNHGTTGFILMTDDATTIHRFASEVAPATKALVERERKSEVGAAARH
jgi:hypothetical protein